jgi:hypothetical protein
MFLNSKSRMQEAHRVQIAPRCASCFSAKSISLR